MDVLNRYLNHLSPTNVWHFLSSNWSFNRWFVMPTFVYFGSIFPWLSHNNWTCRIKKNVHHICCCCWWFSSILGKSIVCEVTSNLESKLDEFLRRKIRYDSKTKTIAMVSTFGIWIHLLHIVQNNTCYNIFIYLIIFFVKFL